MYYLKILKPLEDQEALKQAAALAECRPPNTISNALESLPTLNVPKFNGNLDFWPTFYDLYNQVVHNHPTLSNASKLKYLFSFLEGEPLKLLSGFKISDANYSFAYDKLVKRYQNKRHLATNAINSIMSVTCKDDSSKELRNLTNVFSESLEILKNLQFPVHSWCFILFHLLLEKIPISVRTNFELKYSSEEIPTFKQLFDFLEDRCKALESVNLLSSSKVTKPSISISSKTNSLRNNSCPRTSSFSVQNSNYKIQCYLCKDSHGLSKCPKFLEKSPSERNTFARQNKLCLNCLYHGHATQACNSRFRCRVSGCGKRHHSSLHMVQSSISGSISSASVNDEASGANITQVLNCTNINDHISSSPIQTTVLLATAVVDICDNKGNYVPVRIMLDSGSQSCFISEKCIRRIGLSKRSFSTSIFGLNHMSSFSSKGLTHCTIRPQNTCEPVLSFDAIVVPKLCSNIPSFDLEKRDYNHLKGLKLADPNYFFSSSVDLLVGAELFGQIVKEGRIVGRSEEPSAIETIFGWILLGKVEILAPTSNSITSHYLSTSEIPLEIIVPKFCEIEQIPAKTFSSPEDIRAEEIFKKTTRRDSTGRFIVSLPFKNGEPDLGDTYSQAFRRFSLLEKRLIKNPKLYQGYREFMQEYLDSGHMSKVSSANQNSSPSCYLPHHCVLKPDSVSTKLRVVWDGSAVGSKGTSLNSTLLSGGKLQKDITSLLLLFRLSPVVFIADIKAMFRQIWVEPAHRNFQKILWRFSPDEPLSEWTLNTVSFGLNCSPFLAMRVLKELADLEQVRFPEACKILRTQTYIDDILGTSSSVESALSLQRELIELLRLGGFELRKWASNSPQLLSTVSDADRQMPLSFDKEEPQFLKVLGLQWHPYSDCFSYHCKTSETICTKRSLLSDLSRHFDPLGLLSPVILFMKSIMQKVWRIRVSWDDPLPISISDIWLGLKAELPLLSKLSLSRRVLVDNYVRCELHAFGDSSMTGYGAAIYLRVETLDSVSVSLLCAKGRVAPLKTISLPKLELAAAKLLSDLVFFVKETYNMELLFDNITAWSDSKVVLAWLRSHPCRWKPFVANRVSHIQDIIPYSSWKYIPSELNPADVVSRGLTPNEILTHDLWWNGPPFLSRPKSEWVNLHSFFEPDEKELEIISSEEKTLVFNSEIEIHFIDRLLANYSNLFTIQKIIVQCIRFIKNCQVPNKKCLGMSTADELQHSLMILVKHVQQTTFSDIIDKIRNNQLLPKPFRKLSPFLDSKDFLRVGGRLKNAPDISFDVKHPLLLPRSHQFTILLIEKTHREFLHPGLKTLHHILLQQYWILSARKAIEQVLSRCIRCYKVRPKTYAPPLMASLPSYRISQIKPFSHVALDFCGPFSIVMHRGIRNQRIYKSYVCVFVCTATTAIHLEVSLDLSTESFIAAFRRFIARRGSVTFCQSDNGTNFTGAYNELLNLAFQASEKLSLKWVFTPPTGPHFNGLAEAGVKRFKSHFVRVIGEQRLSLDELTTLICQIEAVLNSRPLCSQSSDPNDLIPLTPAHFLVFGPLVPIVPEPDISGLKLNRLSRWQLIQRIQSDFWKRYFTEYLNTMQQRTKWTNAVPEVQLNDLVLIKKELVSPLKWPLGRVIDLHPGKDGSTRVVTVKTANGQLRRPVVRLCPLPTLIS